MLLAISHVGSRHSYGVRQPLGISRDMPLDARRLCLRCHLHASVARRACCEWEGGKPKAHDGRGSRDDA